MTNALEQANLAAARRYIQLVENFAHAADFEGVLHPEIQHHEFPNLLMKNGSKRDFTTMAAGPQQGRKILANNRFEIANAFAGGDWVTLEMIWSGTLAIPVGAMAAGAELKAFIATILQFKDGLIITQHQYDCYEPLPTS